MDKDALAKVQLQYLFEMFADRVEEDVIYIVFTENEKRIESTIEQLLVIAGDPVSPDLSKSPLLTPSYDIEALKTNGTNSSPGSSRAQSPEGFPDDETIEELSRASKECRLFIPQQQQIHVNSEPRRPSSSDSRSNRDIELESKTSSDSLGDEDQLEFKKVKNKHRFKKKSPVPRCTTVPSASSSGGGTSKTCDEQNSDVASNDLNYYEDDWTESENSSDDVDSSINRIYQALDEMLMERNECYQKAYYYNVRKMYPVSSYYADLATKITNRMTKRSNTLVDLLIKKSEGSDSVDLHGLNPQQACLVVSKLLKIKQENLLIDKQGEVCVDIITGWGKHSILGGRLKPCIMALLDTKSMVYQHLNRGALRVTIKRI